MHDWINSLTTFFSLPQYGLSSLFLVSFVSATLLPLGSEPALFGLVKLRPDLFWIAIAVAASGNTLGGAVSWAMGRGSEQWLHGPHSHVTHRKALAWLEHLGPKACLLSWLPVVGDPLCAVAGWLKLPFWPCVGYMAVGKLARYIVMTGGLVWLFPGGM